MRIRRALSCNVVARGAFCPQTSAGASSLATSLGTDCVRPQGLQPEARARRARQQRRSGAEGAEKEDAARGHLPRDEAS